MNVWVDKSGRRNREYRPYIEEEDQANSVYPYSPNGPGFYYGLYKTAQPTCGSWIGLYNQYPSKIPSEVVDRTGRLHINRPSYWRHGYKYDPLLRHTKPTN